MLNKTFYLFIALSFLSSALLEASEIDLNALVVESSVCDDDNITDGPCLDSTHCNDCENDDCSKSGSCCHNSCHTPFYISTNENISNPSNTLKSKIQWHLYNHYISPLIDPTLKPPLFS
jgi:hypothetical protein